MYNLTLQTDAYHMTMGYLVTDPMQTETYVLYTRAGGPQVVLDLSALLSWVLASMPTREQVLRVATYWRVPSVSHFLPRRGLSLPR
jgi:hypothetical protein